MSSKVLFHHITGSSIKLSEDKLSAYRKKPFEEFDNGWLFSASYLNSNNDFQIQILHLIYSQYESFQIGITSENPVDLKNAGSLSQNEIFKNSWMLHNDRFYYQNDDNIITSEEYDLNLSELEEGDLIGVNINEKRELCFTHNGIPFRIVAEEIPQNVWAFVNLFGNCSYITIIPLESPITISQKNKMIPKVNQISKIATPIEGCEINFHSYCGKEVRLSNNNKIAQRKNPTNEFRNAVVISNTSLNTDKIFKLRIEGLINKWNGSIEFGVTIHNPDSFELPATMTNLRSGTLVLSGNSILTNGHGNQLPYSPISLDDLKIGDEIGVQRNSTGDINFFINDNDLGIAGNIPIEMEIWAIIDLYGRTIKVAIPDNKPNSPFLSKDLETRFPDSNDKLLFHSNCGKNILISQDGCSASRINDQEFNNGIVFSNRPLNIGDIWIIKLVRCIDQWAGNLEIGVTTMVPGECDLPSTMTDLNTGYTVMLTSNGLVVNGCPLSQIEHSMDLETVHSVLLTGISSLIENYTLGIALIDRSKLQFFINNADLGIVTLEEGDNNLYGVIDLYGKAAEVSISFNESCIRKYSKIDKQFNSNDLSFDEIKLITENLKDDNDVDRYLDHVSSDNGLNEMLIDADRSFLRLLTNEETFTDETQTTATSQIRFHEIHGRNVILTEVGRTAYRPSPNNEFKNALVMSSRPLVTDELFEICVEKMTDHWSGSLEIGVTLIKPDELNFPGTLSQLDKDCWILSGSCLMNNGITARNDYRLDMDNIQVNSRIGVVRRQNGILHFLLDDEDMGPAYFNVPFGIYVILDLYGQCSQVSITNKTGIKLLGVTGNADENSIREFLNTSPRTQNEYFSPQDGELTLPSMFSVLERTMFALKKNLSSSSENLGSFRYNKVEVDNKIFSNDSKNSLFAEEKIIESKSLFYESISGTGITADGIGNFYTHKQNLNCVIQFSHPLKSNFYYEFLFWNNKNHGYNIDPISFGIISEKFSSEILPDNLSSIKSPNWIIRGGRLFVNNKLRCQNFAPSLTRYKKNILVGLYFYDNSNLEIYVDHISIGKVVSEIQEDCYLTINLRGWFNTLITLGMCSKPNYSLSQSGIYWQFPNYSYEHQTDFPTDNIEDGLLLDYHQLSNSDDNLNIEDELIVLIVNELSQLLPSFFIIMHGIDSSRLTEKVVNRNNDIVLCVRKKLLSNYSISQFINKFNCKTDIQKYLIEELSNRFSHLPELKHLGNSTFEIARTLRRRLICEKIPYDEKKSAFIIPYCSINIEIPKISRCKSGSEFGLCILNQELMSKKFRSYEIKTIQNNSRINTDSNIGLNTLILGVILIENNHFPNSEDIFRFFMNIPCPKRINHFHNVITHHLELQKFESKAAVLIIENDCVYFNGKKIFQHLPFNMKNISDEDHLSFTLIENDLEIADIYLSIRNNESVTNYKVFTETWLKSPNIIKTSPTKNIYYYIPFVWLQNQCEITVTTEGKSKSISICDIQNIDEQDWLEKHYNDGLNKESFHSGINSDLTLNQKDRKCISVSRSNEIKKSLALPDVYFHNHLADCYCNKCYYSINGITTDPSKDFRLPFGWVKYTTRFNKDDGFNLSQWKLAYLTVSHGLLHRLLSTNNPINILKNIDSSNSTQVTWLKLPNSNIPCNRTIVVSPWQPLIGCYLNEDDSIAQCTDGLINYFDPLTFLKVKAKIALEVKVKPTTFKNLECKIINENQCEIKRIIPKEIDGDCNKKSIDFNISRPINQKTVWILNGDEYSLVITGLLMKI